ncbi:MAG: thiamine-phosphate kinase [Gammaproteobacteria bacterium]
MASDEFDIIQRYFNSKALAFSTPELALGIGDDCTLLDLAPHSRLAMSMDLLQEGVHFLTDSDPYLLGKRTLLVNLSDLAAMGARPVCFTLGLSLPNSDEQWLQAFSEGLAEVAQAHSCALVGGDLTSSSVAIKTICVQVHGVLPKSEAMLRSGAKVGDKIYVTGTLGDAAAGLAVLQGREKAPLSADARAALIEAFYVPESRVAAGQLLRTLASSCIDLSDGLASDLQHILKASDVGARIELTALPVSSAFQEATPQGQWFDLALGGGDDYELCFTLAPELKDSMEAVFSQHGIGVKCVGSIREGSGIDWLHDGQLTTLNVRGYNHFAQSRTQGVV